MPDKRKRGDDGDNYEELVYNFSSPAPSEKRIKYSLERESEFSKLQHEESVSESSVVQMESSPLLSSSKDLSFFAEDGTSENPILTDRQHLLTLFPQEVWLLICKQLDHDDLEKLCNSSLFLRQLLLPQRGQFLFRNVWGVVEREYKTMDCYELLQLRLVCHSWNQVIENFCQLFHNETFGKYSVLLQISNENTHRVVSLADDFSYSTTARNPFFARGIEITFCDEDSDDLINSAFNVLKTYGHYLWYCHIYIGETDWFPSAVAWYSKLGRVLKEMPNLKILEISNFLFPFLHSLEWPANCIEEVWREINSNPLPCFKNLQELKVHHLPTLLFQELLQQNNHIATLYISRFRHHADYEIYMPMENLTLLSISFYTEKDFLKLTNPKVNWPLTKLCLYFRDDCFNNWQTIFNVLHDKFRKTLTHLTLLLPKVRVNVDNRLPGSTCALHLRQLTHLHLHLHNVACLDFLLPLRHSLTNLNLKIQIYGVNKNEVMRLAGKMERDSIIKLLSCAKSDTKTNIWSVLTELKKLDVVFSAGAVPIIKLKASRHQ